MSSHVFSYEVSIEELVAKILMERRITPTEQRMLSNALLFEEELDEDDWILINRVFYGVRRGLLTIGD